MIISKRSDCNFVVNNQNSRSIFVFVFIKIYLNTHTHTHTRARAFGDRVQLCQLYLVLPGDAHTFLSTVVAVAAGPGENNLRGDE